MAHWWNMTTQVVAEKYATDVTTGLSSEKVAERLREYGHNQLMEQRGRTRWDIVIAQFKDFIVWVLIGAALVSGFLGEWIDTIAIIGIVVVNAVLGFMQEHRAEKSLAALKKLASPTSKVIREGHHRMIPSADIVPGDLIELEAGDYVPADARLVYTSPQCATQEASLTGESLPVMKHTAALPDETALAERKNMVYMGTPVVSGKARALVIATGMNTELGHIAGMIQTIGQEATPLQKKLESFGKWIVYVCFAVVAIVFALELLRGGSLMDVFLTAVSLAVAAIPEGLPAVVTVSLALGVQKMVKRHVLIRKLSAVETLGCAAVICTDKTGTLTKNEMTVQKIFSNNTFFNVTGIGYAPVGNVVDAHTQQPIVLKEKPECFKTLLYSTLCNGAQLVEKKGVFSIIGDPTEGALIVAAAKAGIREGEKEFPFVEEIPFDSQRKKMAMIRNHGARYLVVVKGAPEAVLNNCDSIEEHGTVHPLRDTERTAVLAANTTMTRDAMRVLAVAYKEMDTLPQVYEADAVEHSLTFVGLIAMIDPPREEAKIAVRTCQDASIRTVMITGDNKETAVAIARQLGFFNENTLAVTGDELDAMPDETLRARIGHIAVYARVSPEHKFRIVKMLRQNNQVVAMTGDGVNDAPAVKEADIGVAMGITGTDVTKEVSDMIITDDNFASIVAAVEEGRGIYDNIKKFIHYLLSCNVGEILVMFIASLIGMPVPLLPIHILWVNLVTDGFPALALGVDPPDPTNMKQPPRPSNEGVVTKQGARLMLVQGLLIALCSLGAFSFVLFIEGADLNRARTAAFVTLACSQLFHAFNCRSMTQSIFSLGILTNKKLVYATLLSFVLLVGVVSTPFLIVVFKTHTLSVVEWLWVIVCSSLPLWVMEGVKLMRRAKQNAECKMQNAK